MRIGCLQFAPAVGDVDNNLNRADAVLNRADPQELDLLVLPELAFSGYNFRSLQEISPFLEPSGSGITSLWARTQALKHDCTVIVGYPEKVDLAERWPANPEYYNSAIVVSYEGDTVANYRKTHLYYTDETWALENPKGFFGKPLPGLGRVSIGICMDLNPYKFQTPWETFEFATHVVNSRTRLVVVSMAWITQEDPRIFSQEPQEADMNTLTYWISRLEPIIRAEWDEEVIVVFANRTGTEDEATYAGTSAVVGIKSGEVWVYGILGRGDKELLVVDTDAPPFAKLVYRPDGDTLEVENESPSDLTHHRLSLPSGPNSPEQDFRRHLGSYTNDRPDTRAPEPTARQEQTRKAASYHRDDLSISVSQKREAQNRQEPFSVHTPSAPSPTPQHMRPRLPTQTAEPATHQYFDSDSFNSSRGATFFGENNQHQDTNTGLTHHQMGLHRKVSPSNSSEGYLSEGVTSGNYGIVHSHHDVQETEDLWMLGPEDDHERHGRVENRHSLRSDVSVWNNQHGRPRTMATLPTPPQEPTTKKAPQIREKTSQSRTSRRSRSRQPESERSRHESRSSNPNRAKTTRPAASELKAGLSLLNEMAPRADSAQEPLLRFLEDRSDDPAGKFPARDGKSANHSLPRMDTNVTHPHHERALSGNSIPVAMDPSIWRNLAFPASALPSQRQPSERQLSEHRSSKRQPPKRQPSERRSSDHVQNDQPILRPASRSRIGKRDALNQRRDDDQGPLSNPNASRDRSGSATQSNHDSRAISRGRPRSSKPSDSQQIQSPPGREPRTNSRRSRKPSQSDIDLSQFRLIEDYPSRNCPLHGSRSRSRARHGHSSSRQRTPATGQTQAPLPRQRTGSRPPMQNTPASAVPKVLYTEKAASRSTTDLPKQGKPAEQAALRVKHESSDSVDTMTSSASTLSPGQDEPRTPVAMVLMPELEDTAYRTAAANRFPPVKSVEREDERSHIGRPRSAIW